MKAVKSSKYRIYRLLVLFDKIVSRVTNLIVKIVQKKIKMKNGKTFNQLFVLIKPQNYSIA